MEPDPHQLDPDHLPTPFTADEIRAGSPDGRTLRYRVEREGTDPVIRVTRYANGNAEATERHSWTEAPDGRPMGEPEVERSSWLELQAHASFPAATTVRGEEEVTTPAGTFRSLRYERTDDGGTWRFWFALDLPGQPVRFEHEVAGRVVFSSVLLEAGVSP